MALIDTAYRLHINWTYSTTAAAQSAEASINSALANAGRAETCVRTTAVINLLIVSLDEATAVNLRNTLVPAWSSQTRTGGKAAIVRSNDTN